MCPFTSRTRKPMLSQSGRTHVSNLGFLASGMDESLPMVLTGGGGKEEAIRATVVKAVQEDTYAIICTGVGKRFAASNAI